jgi:hypothetical protein
MTSRKVSSLLFWKTFFRHEKTSLIDKLCFVLPLIHLFEFPPRFSKCARMFRWIIVLKIYHHLNFMSQNCSWLMSQWNLFVLIHRWLTTVPENFQNFINIYSIRYAYCCWREHKLGHGSIMKLKIETRKDGQFCVSLWWSLLNNIICRINRVGISGHDTSHEEKETNEVKTWNPTPANSFLLSVVITNLLFVEKERLEFQNYDHRENFSSLWYNSVADDKLEVSFYQRKINACERNVHFFMFTPKDMKPKAIRKLA